MFGISNEALVSIAAKGPTFACAAMIASIIVFLIYGFWPQGLVKIIISVIRASFVSFLYTIINSGDILIIKILSGEIDHNNIGTELSYIQKKAIGQSAYLLQVVHKQEQY